jgi:hypothetical protein
MTQIQLSNEESVFIATGIREFGREAAEQQKWLSSFVSQFGALPLYSGWTETIGIRPDGKLVKWSTEDEYVDCRDLDPKDQLFVRAALVSGAKRYPALSSLIPVRPSDARTCEVCGGTGQFPIHPKIICGCGGLGWVEGSNPA